MNDSSHTTYRRVAKWGGFASGLAILALTATAHALPIVTLDFNVVAPAAGSISYAGGANPLVGAGIAVDSVMALDANGNQVGASGTCLSCTLSFTTGNFMGASSLPSMWNFAGGGVITLTGGIDFSGDNIAGNNPNEPPLGSTLFTGSFGPDGASVVALSGNYKIAQGSFFDTKDPLLLAFFGLPTTSFEGGFNITLRASTGAAGDPFTSTRLEGGDVVNSPVPEPASLILLGSGLIGFRYLAIRRRLSG